MTVTERLMKPGSFSVRLREDYPWSTAAAVDMFDHIVITPTRLEPIAAYSDANILAAAIYTGVITDKPSPRGFDGAGLAWWLGSDEGIGKILDTPAVLSAATLSTWVTLLLGYYSPLTAGTITNTGLGTLTATYQWCTQREALDAICRALGAEWRTNPSFTLDAAKSPDLFVTSPTVVITRKDEGQDGPYRGLDGTLIVTAKDVRQYVTKAITVAQGQGASVATASSSGSTTYRDGRNNLVVLERLVNAPSDASTNAAAIAAQQVGQWNQVRRELSLSSRTYNVTRHARPGDYVYAFDQLAELVDPANQIIFRGEVISPIKLRVYALTWPITRGMGVYARRSTGASYTYVDLTDYVEWEDDTDVIWDVGAAPRASNDVNAATAGATAYLGANAEVAARATPDVILSPGTSGRVILGTRTGFIPLGGGSASLGVGTAANSAGPTFIINPGPSITAKAGDVVRIVLTAPFTTTGAAVGSVSFIGIQGYLSGVPTTLYSPLQAIPSIAAQYGGDGALVTPLITIPTDGTWSFTATAQTSSGTINYVAGNTQLSVEHWGIR